MSEQPQPQQPQHPQYPQGSFDPYAQPHEDPYAQPNPYGQAAYGQGGYDQGAYGQGAYGQPQQQPMQPYDPRMLSANNPYAQPTGPLGEIRSPGMVILLSIVTFGIYGIYWNYKTCDELQRHNNQGLGGVLALVLSLIGLGVVLDFTIPDEVQKMYQRRGIQSPVSAITGLWIVLGVFIIVGPFIWIWKIQNALNDYWRSLGAQG